MDYSWTNCLKKQGKISDLFFQSMNSFGNYVVWVVMLLCLQSMDLLFYQALLTLNELDVIFKN